MEALYTGCPQHLEVDKVSANDLLIWMSARVEGSWPQFRAAVERLQAEDDVGGNSETDEEAMSDNLPVYQAVRLGLERLAHVEFRSVVSDRGWRVVPPTLAITGSGDDYRGILCGARSPGLSASLLRLSGNVSVDSQSALGVPDRICLASTDSEFLEYAGQALGLHVQPSAPTVLLAAMPPLDDPRNWFSSEPPSAPGWTIDQFSTRNLRWTGATPESVSCTIFGLFRFQLRYQRFYFLRWQGRTFRVPVQVGKYAVLRRQRNRRLIWYDRSQAVLSVPIACRPPLLIERALVLCSGQLPRLERETGRLHYSRVTREIARMAATLLCQEIHSP